MNIFESLENLNVSEECFNDIMDIVEEILSEKDSLNNTSHITRVHGEPEYDYLAKDENGVGYGWADVPNNKSAELVKRASKTHEKVRPHKEGGGSQGDQPKLSGTYQDKKDQEDLKFYRSTIKGLTKRGMKRDDAIKTFAKKVL